MSEKNEVQENIYLYDFCQEMLELSSDYEKYEKEIFKIENHIREVEPSFNHEHDDEELFYYNKIHSLDKIHLGSDIIRSTEILFRPYLIGNNQKGLIESLENSLNCYDSSTIQNILSNVFIIGGGAMIDGLKERLENDLFVHFTGKGIKNLNIHKVENSILQPFYGIQRFYQDYNEKVNKHWFYSRKEYQEHGVNLFKNCPIGNM